MTLPPSFTNTITDEADDMVARRIVMRREVWEQLVHLAEALQETRELEVSATDVAVIALEAGLAEVRKSSGKHGRPASASQAASRAQSGKQSRSQAASRSQAVSRSQAASRAQSGGASGKHSRSLKRPLPVDLSADERAEVQHLVSEIASARGRQRTIALWLGQNKKRVALESLRELCVVHGAYNVANFAQNMKKDGALFDELKDDTGERLGWRLTKQGVAEAKLMLESALQPA